MAPLPATLAAWALAATVRLETHEEARQLCASLQLPERAARAAPNASPERAAAAQEERRRRAREHHYLLDVEGEGLFFDVDPDGARLLLTERSAMRGAGQSLRVWLASDPELATEAGGEAARRIAAAARRGDLVLRLLFALPEDSELAVCSHPPGSREWSLAVEPIAWSWLVRDRIVARGGRGPQEAGERPKAGPRVEVDEPLGLADPTALHRALEEQRGALERCRPGGGAGGTLAVEIELPARAGPPRAVRMALDAAGDGALGRCVLRVLRRAPLPAGKGRVQVPIRFAAE